MTDIPPEPNTAAIANLLTQAFMDERDLRRFCRDSTEFRPVLELVSEGAGLQDHVDKLISYCETRLLFDELLAGVERANPRQYARIAPLLGESVPTLESERSLSDSASPQEAVSQTQNIPQPTEISPRERDEIRARRNEALVNQLRQSDGIQKCTVFQLEDHTDKGYLLHVTFDDTQTSAADVLSAVRRTIEQLFPDIPYWGELRTESDNAVGFAYTYIDEYNKWFT